ncbi:DUF4304 domain-containing protein [Anaerobacillus sp. MEB173]|uniref:DUF4304 domain-containing protein n=1 Tax=Anaerobacillus sp. MEB173 TaxID=3383345 RepID=UPI003F910A67
MRITKEQLIDCLKPVFKLHGFKKERTTWRKTTEDIIFVLNIQGSQWSKEDYYINVAIYIRAMGVEKNPPFYSCHIQSRIDEREKSWNSICSEILDWFEKHGEIHKLKILLEQNDLPLPTTLDAKKYLAEI